MTVTLVEGKSYDPDDLCKLYDAQCLKDLIHGAINCPYNCNRIAATFEAISIALAVAEEGFCIGSVKPDS